MPRSYRLGNPIHARPTLYSHGAVGISFAAQRTVTVNSTLRMLVRTSGEAVSLDSPPPDA